jgi:hypothetical protein
MMSMHCCNEMKKCLESGEIAIRYFPKFREYGISYTDGDTSFQEISFCPWCGKRTPDSFRDQWFAEIRSLGLEPDQESIPKKYKTDQWWIEKSS